MVRVEKIIPGGQALGTMPDGKKIFFWNALPGEEVISCDITKNKSNFTEAIATEISHPSPFRVEPKDVCFLSTSPWQILDYDYELKLKPELVVEIFREHQIDIKTPDIITDGKDYYYRNKMEYALYWDNESQEIKLAFHARGSHRKIPIKKSSIERPELFKIATEIVAKLNADHEEARKYQSLLLRCNQSGEISGGLFENGHPHPVFQNLTDTLLGHEYSYSPNGFFQINLPVYEFALKEIKKHITTEKVLDLYAGVGTIGLSVAQGHSLTLVECDRSAFVELANNARGAITTFSEHVWRRAKHGASEPRDDGSEPAFRKNSNGAPLSVLAKSEDALAYIAPDQTVIVDPPRAGCDSKLINKLNEIKPSTIIYLSCNPATQARDVKMLLENYHIKEIKSFNFFPHTPHIENLVVLSL